LTRTVAGEKGFHCKCLQLQRF